MQPDTIPTLGGAQIVLPEEFQRLYDLADNQWWSWNDEARELWPLIDARRWHQTPYPISLLVGIEQSRWEALATEPIFLDRYKAVMRAFDRYMTSTDTWYDRQPDQPLQSGPVAYLCAEYGLHHKLPFYSGGLGVLAGDHVKTASDLGIPMVAVGMLYRRGYFRQAVDPAGDQQHYYPAVDLARRPVRPVADRAGRHLTVKLAFPGRDVSVAVWRLQVGRVPLLLLDTDVPENEAYDRPISHLLYVRGREMRLAQELVLGIGAVKALAALDIVPAVWHVNEGHAAFSILERLNRLMGDGEDFESALAAVRASTLFTLHTPVPAGNEKFELAQVQRYLDYLYPDLPSELPARLGRSHEEAGHVYDMGAVAIQSSSFVNGVSRRHGEVATHDWGALIGGKAVGITNGVHVPTWLGHPTARLLEEHIGLDWDDALTQPDVWTRLESVPDEEVWLAHSDQKELLLRMVRERFRAQLSRHGAGPDVLRDISSMLPADRLTIGFARRFATYKRATLLLTDLPRLQAILTNPERPVQVLFAGKAHPADAEGQGLIRRVVELSGWPEFRGHLLFIEDYDMELAGLLTAGVDVWLNNPVPPKEASGTSGMKAGLNGTLNASIGDGWWAEAVDHGRNGWRFGPEGLEVHSDHDDAADLYQLLESQIVPLFYDRDHAGVPKGWVEMMKRSMVSIIPDFSSHRMLTEYAQLAYFPLGRAAEAD